MSGPFSQASSLSVSGKIAYEMRILLSLVPIVYGMAYIGSDTSDG